MDTSSTPTCPECGFRIYNRRFPRCESCGSELPESIVYSPVERFELQLEEEQRSLEKARGSSESSLTTPGSLDAALLTAVMDLTRR